MNTNDLKLTDLDGDTIEFHKNIVTGKLEILMIYDTENVQPMHGAIVNLNSKQAAQILIYMTINYGSSWYKSFKKFLSQLNRNRKSGSIGF